MKKVLAFASTLFIASITFGQTTTSSNTKKEPYKSPNTQNQYGTNYNRNNPDAGQSNYGYGNRTSSKTYDDRKINGSTKDNVHPSVLEQQRKRDEYNSTSSQKPSTSVDVKKTKTKED